MHPSLEWLASYSEQSLTNSIVRGRSCEQDCGTHRRSAVRSKSRAGPSSYWGKHFFRLLIFRRRYIVQPLQYSLSPRPFLYYSRFAQRYFQWLGWIA